MRIIPEIEVTSDVHSAITELRNASFPRHQADRSYFKQLPGYRFLDFRETKLVGYMGLDYRVVGINGSAIKVFGIVEFCVSQNSRGRGIGTSMLKYLDNYVRDKNVDFIVLLADQGTIYSDNGFTRVEAEHSWFRVHDHESYGVAIELIPDFYVKPLRSIDWPSGRVDWLGYMY